MTISSYHIEPGLAATFGPIGIATGIGIAYLRSGSFGGYVGWALLAGIIGAGVGYAVLPPKITIEVK